MAQENEPRNFGGIKRTTESKRLCMRSTKKETRTITNNSTATETAAVCGICEEKEAVENPFFHFQLKITYCN